MLPPLEDGLIICNVLDVQLFAAQFDQCSWKSRVSVEKPSVSTEVYEEFLIHTVSLIIHRELISNLVLGMNY